MNTQKEQGYNIGRGRGRGSRESQPNRPNHAKTSQEMRPPPPPLSTSHSKEEDSPTLCKSFDNNVNLNSKQTNVKPSQESRPNTAASNVSSVDIAPDATQKMANRVESEANPSSVPSQSVLGKREVKEEKLVSKLAWEQKPLTASAQQPAPIKAQQPQVPQKESEDTILDKINDDFSSQALVKKPVQRGTIGRRIQLEANYYLIELNQTLTIHHYDVSVEPYDQRGEKEKDRALKDKQLVKEIFRYFRDKCVPESKNRIFYNFSKNMFSFDELKKQEFEIMAEGRKFNLKLEKINKIDVDPKNYLKNAEMSAMMLNILLNHNLTLTQLSANRSFFNKELQDIGLGVKLWKGVYTSVRPSEIGLTLNVDTAVGAFYSTENVIDLALKYYKCNNPSQLKAKIDSDKDGQNIGVKFMDSIWGREVKVSTTGYRKKIKGFGPDALHKFKYNDQLKTIKDYNKELYKIEIKYPNLPCLDFGKENYTPMELCTTEARKKNITDAEKEVVRKHAVKPAPVRMDEIQDWMNGSKLDQDPILKEANMKVPSKRIIVGGRVIPPPDIQYGRNRVVESKFIGEKGSWNHSKNEFIKPQSGIKWAIINTSRLKDQQIEDFIGIMLEVSYRHGMKGIDENPPIIYYDIWENREKSDIAILEGVKQLISNLSQKNKLHMIVIIFSETNRVYKAIKTCCDLKSGLGIATQCLSSKNVEKANDLVISNILLKVNSKLGGTNFTLSRKNPLFDQYLAHPFFNEPLMIFGADVTHPAPNNTQTESIAAVTASLDLDCSYYVARLRRQKAFKTQRQEIILDLDNIFVELIQEFHKQNKQCLKKSFPQRIVFFRDGVSEGEFKKVLHFEINKIRAACAKISPGYQPGITFVVVQKRHHTRFVPTDPKQQNGRGQNVPPGTVVDSEVVTPYLYDYFLCSHYGIQGTSKPCRYFVLHDDNQFSMDQMQLLSHYLCHIYSRTSRSVSYPAPAYYAHLAAFRGREYIFKAPLDKMTTSQEIELHDNIKNRMFFT